MIFVRKFTPFSKVILRQGRNRTFYLYTLMNKEAPPVCPIPAL